MAAEVPFSGAEMGGDTPEVAVSAPILETPVVAIDAFPVIYARSGFLLPGQAAYMVVPPAEPFSNPDISSESSQPSPSRRLPFLQFLHR